MKKHLTNILVSAMASILTFVCLTLAVGKSDKDNLGIQSDIEPLSESERNIMDFVRVNISYANSNLYVKLADFEGRLNKQDTNIMSMGNDFSNEFQNIVSNSLGESQSKYREMTTGILEAYALKQQKLENDLAETRTTLNETTSNVMKIMGRADITRVLDELDILEKNILDLENRINANTGRDAGIDEKILALEKSLRDIRMSSTSGTTPKGKNKK